MQAWVRTSRRTIFEAFTTQIALGIAYPPSPLIESHLTFWGTENGHEHVFFSIPSIRGVGGASGLVPYDVCCTKADRVMMNSMSLKCHQ